MALHLAFRVQGKIMKMTIAAADLHPLMEAIRAAAQSSAS